MDSRFARPLSRIEKPGESPGSSVSENSLSCLAALCTAQSYWVLRFFAAEANRIVHAQLTLDAADFGRLADIKLYFALQPDRALDA